MDIDKLMKQAQAMQKQLEEALDKVNEAEFEGSASNGLVKVKINGENKFLSVSIDPEILNPDDKEMIEDLIVIAANEAIDKADEAKKATLGSIPAAKGLLNR